MPILSHLESVAAVAEASVSEEHFSYAVRDFLDGFYAHPSSLGLDQEPRFLAEVLHDQGYADAYLAALAEHLSGQYTLPLPAWSQNPTRSLREPRFAYKTPEGRIFLLIESPTAFRVRNIFISAEGMTRA